MIEKPMTEAEAAIALGISIGTLRAERKAGRIAHTGIRSLIRYREADLTEYLERNRKPCRDQSHPTELASSSCIAGRVARSGTSVGMIADQDRPDARALAQQVLGKLSA